MSALSPPVLHRLDLACKHISETFGGFSGPYLVGSAQERTAGPGSDLDLRLILADDVYDALMAGTPPGFASLLDFALGAYVRELTNLPIDFQVQRMTEANERHSGKQRNPLGRRSLTNWIGDARPEPTAAAPIEASGQPVKKEGPFLRKASKPSAETVKATYYRRGRCERCKKTAERGITFTGKTLQECHELADAWNESPLLHRRCEVTL